MRAAIGDLIAAIGSSSADPEISQGSLISVNSLAGKAGAFYEKLRYMVDYKDEHTIRRSAIERILKRKLVLENKTSVALSLLQELVRGGYLANNSVFEETARDIQEIINKAVTLRKLVEESTELTSRQRGAIISLCASEITFFLYPTPVEEAVAEAFYATVRPAIVAPETINSDDVDAQTYAAVYRSLYKEDESTLWYRMWVRYVPAWTPSPDLASLQVIAEHFTSLEAVLSSQIKSPWSWQLSGKLRNHALYFSIIKEMSIRYGSGLSDAVHDPAYVDAYIKEFLAKKYARKNDQIRKSGMRAVLYIFCTKIVLALLLEFPYELFVLQSIDYLPLATNILFHPLLLLLMTRSIRPLGSENTEAVIKGVRKILYETEIEKIRVLQPKPNRFFSLIFFVLYVFMFALSFGIILLALLILHFNVVSILLFLFFLTLVSYFGLRIRYTAYEWKVTGASEGAWSVLWGVFTLPIIRAGRWLNRKFSSVNIFVFLLDFIIEAPFKLLLEILDSFISFLKEKKEEVV